MHLCDNLPFRCEGAIAACNGDVGNTSERSERPALKFLGEYPCFIEVVQFSVQCVLVDERGFCGVSRKYESNSRLRVERGGLL